MIYETDTDLVYLWNGSAWVETVSALTKAPRGIISVTNNTTSTGSISAETLVATSPSFTAVANRNYRITYYEPVAQYASGTVNTAILRIRLTSIAGAEQAFSEVKISGANNATGIVTTVKTLTAGSTVFVATVAPAGGGNMSCFRSATATAQLSIEDIGAA